MSSLPPFITFNPQDLKLGLTAEEFDRMIPPIQQLLTYYYQVGPIFTIHQIFELAQPLMDLIQQGTIPSLSVQFAYSEYTGQCVGISLGAADSRGNFRRYDNWKKFKDLPSHHREKIDQLDQSLQSQLKSTGFPLNYRPNGLGDTAIYLHRVRLDQSLTENMRNSLRPEIVAQYERELFEKTIETPTISLSYKSRL